MRMQRWLVYSLCPLILSAMLLNAQPCSSMECGQWKPAQSLGVGETLLDIAYGDGLFVAVGYQGVIRTSSDALSWTRQKSITSDRLVAVTWAGTYFAAVDSDGTFFSSPDGFSWTERSQLPAMSVNEIVWTGSQLAVLGVVEDYSSSDIFTSAGGLSWNAFSLPAGYYLADLIWDGTALFGVGAIEGVGPLAARSIDGIDWELTSVLDGANLYEVAFNGSTYVAGSSSGLFAFSDDGEHWAWSVFGKRTFSDIIWAGNRFVALANECVQTSQCTNLLESNDGFTWTVQYPPTTHRLDNLAYGAGLVVATGEFGAIVSGDEDNKLTLQDPGIDTTLASAAWNGERFVVVGGEGFAATSINGIEWDRVLTPADQFLWEVVATEDQFLAVGNNGTIISSPDGLSWTLQNSQTSEHFMGVEWTGSTYVAVGLSGKLFSSPDGVNWDPFGPDLSPFGRAFDVMWTGERYILVGSSILISRTGRTWTKVATADNSVEFTSIAGNSDILVAAGSNIYTVEGAVYTSSDGGFYWTKVPGYVGRYILDLIWNGDRFYVFGDYDSNYGSGTIFESENGRTWTSSPGNPNYGILAGAATDSQHTIAVGASGIIYRRSCFEMPQPRRPLRRIVPTTKR